MVKDKADATVHKDIREGLWDNTCKEDFNKVNALTLNPQVFLFGSLSEYFDQSKTKLVLTSPIGTVL